MKQPMGLGQSETRAASADIDVEFAAFFDVEASAQVRRAALLLQSVEEANDVVQEAMVRLYQRWSDIEQPGPYLNRAVLNLCRDRTRHREVRRRGDLRLVDRTGAADTDPPEYEVLDDILAELPFNQRAAVVLRYWGGLSFEEIADELDCSPGSVGPWINRAMNQLREALA